MSYRAEVEEFVVALIGKTRRANGGTVILKVVAGKVSPNPLSTVPAMPGSEAPPKGTSAVPLSRNFSKETFVEPMVGSFARGNMPFRATLWSDGSLKMLKMLIGGTTE